MKLIKLKVPEGKGAQVARIALEAGISQVGVYPQDVHTKGGKVERREVVDIETATPLAKRFMDALTASPVYDARTMGYSLRDARAIVSSKDDVSRITVPVAEPAVDVYETLWPFSHITPSFVGRVVVAALLLSYGLVHDRTLSIAAGLLFMPALPVLLGIAFGGVTASWKLAGRAALAMAAALALTVATGYVVGTMASGSQIEFKDFTPMMPSLALSVAIGIAGALATTDDVGWRELIGLATASQFSLIPAWFGAALAKGFGEGGTPAAVQRLESFGLNTVAMVLVAGAVYAALRMRREALAHTDSMGGEGRSPADDLRPDKLAAA
jgi:hypothetical protein